MKSKFHVIILVLLLLIGSAFPACRPSSQVIKWQMVASWVEDTLFYTQAARAICDRVNQMSNGRLIIEPYPAGSIVGALEVFDAVSEGRVEVGHTWSGYWRDKELSFELFSSIPNQMVAQEWLVWLYGPSGGV